MKAGERVIVRYDARPFRDPSDHPGEVVKVTPSGLLRIKTDDGKYNELFYPSGAARGWNTLSFSEAESEADTNGEKGDAK